VDEKTKEILDGLKLAIQAETDGHNFYLMAAKNTKDKKGKAVLSSLAKDEADHLQYLRTQYKSFLETGGPDSKIKLGKPRVRSGKSPIFSADFKKRLGKADYEMTALSIGTLLELNSIKFYKAESEKEVDPIVKTFYAELAEWESGHYQLLIRQQELLKEDYWFESKFYPF
jgi:rubrerythrin